MVLLASLSWQSVREGWVWNTYSGRGGEGVERKMKQYETWSLLSGACCLSGRGEYKHKFIKDPITYN